MNKTIKTRSDDEIVLPELLKHRQLFLLNQLTNVPVAQSNSTVWEEVMCAGYNPYYQRLEAIVSVKKTTGYNGGLCTNSSLEYVRYFVDFKDGLGYQDMGISSFKVADIPNVPVVQHPLSYSAFLTIDDRSHRKFLDCNTAVIPTLRAVLSWSVAPSANANDVPHFGNAIDADIQLARRPFIYWKELINLTRLKEIGKLADADFEIKLKEPVAEKAEALYEAYKAADIPQQRTFYSTIGARLNSTLNFTKASGMLTLKSLDDFGVNIDKFYDFFNNPGKDADTTYEELTCVGLNTLTDRLAAIVHIKRSSGFIGNLCSKGSNEHIAFWADWNNDGTFDQYLGTTSLNVHDLGNIPAGGLYYTVQLPINVTDRLRPCNMPNIIKVRAVLSWESLPSTTNPDQLNHWGNYVDALVQLRPAFVKGSGLHSAIYYVGGADRFAIDTVSHLYNAGPASPYSNRPWGGGISFNGVIDRNGFGGTIKYRFMVKKAGQPDSTYAPASTTETVMLDDIFTVAPPFADTQTDPDGWFIYKQNPNIGLYNTTNYLATWNAAGSADGPYTIQFEHTDEFSNVVIADQFTIMVCNTGMSVSPTANASVDVSKDLDLVIDGGDCHSYTPQDAILNGHVRALHPYFAGWSLELQPTSHTNGIIPSPSGRVVTAIGDNGDANATWSLDTAPAGGTPLDPCGYTVSLSANTRVILNSNPGYLPYYGPKAVGFAKLP